MSFEFTEAIPQETDKGGGGLAWPARMSVPTGLPARHRSGPSDRSARRGALAYHGGAAAEEIVARDYQRRGRPVAHRRWRSGSGEIDLIARDGAKVIFIEVKKSRSFAQAASRLGRRQMDRLCAAASEFLAGEPAGQLTDIRFDVALVDGGGAVRIIENAFCEA